LKISAAIFDLDGTIVCLPINWERLFDEFKRIMHVDVVRPLVETVSKVDGKTRLEVFAAWDQAELAVVGTTTLCEQGMAIYRKHAHKPRALVTMQGKNAVQAIMERFGLSFEVTFTREDSLDRVEQLRMAAEKLKIQPRDILFVGNAESDIAAARKVGCLFQKV
jgi:HAD superfamily hydrolase (TIGR01549 family)